MFDRVTNWAFDLVPRFRPPADYAELRARIHRRDGIVVPVPGAPDVTLDLYRPGTGDGPFPTVVWAHGGGYVTGRRTLAEHLATALAAEGFVVAALGYALPPFALYPVPVVQTLGVARWVAEGGAGAAADGSRLVLAGDSAGAQIAGQAAALVTNPRLARDMGVDPGLAAERLRAVLLCCGLLDPGALPYSLRPFVRGLLAAYLGPDRVRSRSVLAQMSLSRYATAAFPPTFVTAGNGDPLRRQSYRVTRALTSRGVHVDTLFWHGRVPPVPHEYQFYMDTSAAGLARRRIVEFARRWTAVPAA